MDSGRVSSVCATPAWVPPTDPGGRARGAQLDLLLSGPFSGDNSKKTFPQNAG